MRHKLNKKGQIATSMMVVIALALSGAAIFAMISFNDEFQSMTLELTKLVRETETLKRYLETKAEEFGSSIVINCKTCTEEELVIHGREFDSQRTERFQNEGNMFAKIRNGEFTFEKQEENYKLEIREITFRVERDYNKIESNFDICLIFNSTGDKVNNC